MKKLHESSMLAALVLMACTGVFASAQQVPRASEPPAAAAGHDAQLVAPPSWGPTLTPRDGTAQSAPPAKAEIRPVDPATPATETVNPQASQAAGVRARQHSRRGVDQILTPTPRILGSAAPSNDGVMHYGPSLQPQAPTPAASPSLPRGTSNATCIGASCIGANGQRIDNSGVGSPVVTPQGQLCTRGLVGVQCF